MLAKLPERRCRQKLKHRTRDGGNPEIAQEYFQVSVNIIEAKNLAWAHSQTVNSYVMVMLGKEKYRTNVRKNITDPAFREYILFEWYTTLKVVQHSTLWMGVMEPRCCAPPRLLGETSIDLGVIWAQRNHQVYHKWAQLSVPRDPAAGTVGFLKVDVSIMCRGDVLATPVMISSDTLGESLLPSATEQQTANYLISIYNGFGICGAHEHGARRQEKLPSTYVKVYFGGISAKTAVQAQSNNPCYCEQISITDMFPNVCQTLRLEVCSAVQCFNQSLASIDLNLEQISHDGETGFVPTFGPSLLHMYGNSASLHSGIEMSGERQPFYKGALLVALRTIVPYLQRGIKTTSVEPIAAVHMDSLWAWQDFFIFAPILEVSMLDRRLTGEYCGVAITSGEVPSHNSDNECFNLIKKEIKRRKLHYTGPIDVSKNPKLYGNLDFTNAFPVLQLATSLPDFRFRIYRNNLVGRIAEHLESSISNVEKRLANFEYMNPSELLNNLSNAIDVAADQIQRFFEICHLFDPSADGHNDMAHYSTELDRKQLALQKEELERIYQQIREKIKLSSTVNLMKLVGKSSNECYSITKKDVKMLLVESITITQKLKSLVFKSAQGWPDIVLWLLSEGSRFAFQKISMADILFSEIPEQSGELCGRIQTIYMKPLKCPRHLNVVPNGGCSCIAGKVELLIWMGLNSNTPFFHSCLPQELRIKVKDYEMCVKAPIIMVECRVFIYRAKFVTLESGISPCSFVRINVLNSIRETKVEQKSATPVWDQVLTVSCMTRTSVERITTSPPEVTVEVYDHDLLGKLELIGRTNIQPVVGDKLNVEYAPKLKWQELQNGHIVTGHILLSALVKQVPETLVKSTLYSTNELNETIVQSALTEHKNDEIEVLPRCLKPRSSVYKVDVFWWGLRDVSITRKPCAVLEMDDLTIKSDIITEKKPNCNFPNGRVSQTFEGHLDKAYSPPLTIKLYDSSTYGRVIFLGTNAVKNPTKYLVEWLPKYERETSLNNVSFSSSSFLRVNKTLYVMKSTTSCDTTSECSKITLSSSLVADEKRSTWRRLFSRKEPDEEEYVLLSMHDKEKDNNQLAITSETESQNWWTRFYSSQKDTGDDWFGRNGKIKIYRSELEHQPEFSKFKDWCSTLKLYNGKKTGIPEKDEELRCGFLKAGIAIYRWPPPPDTVAVNWSGVELHQGFFNDFPSNDSTKFLVRVYIVRGLHLTPKDFNSKCDPYVIVKCGSKQYGDRNHFLQNTINPIFGRTYEFQCSLPEDYLLTVYLYDHETMATDGLIGTTHIDLEDRIYSKHQARVGLSSEYNVIGAAKWRDSEKPSDILAKLCTRNHMRPPAYPDGNTVLVNGIEYRDSDKTSRTYLSALERKENLCLNLLHKWHTLPLCGYYLVPEHVESRILLKPEEPSVEQGKVQMWVDIFPLETGIYIPLPVDITPQKIEDYELRVIIWNVHSLRQDGGKKGLDLYVKSWIGNVEQANYTDIHYNSINGEASFNWRMVFQFQYQHSDKKLILMDKGPFTEFEERLPPILLVQVADCDAECSEDYIAMLTLDLNEIPRGSKHIQSHKMLKNMECSKKINLFATRAVRSWWPLKYVDKNAMTVKFAGMIEMELHLLQKEKAVIMPVGLGRDPPFPLPEPNRPDATKIKSTVLQSMFKRGASEFFLGVIFVTLIIAVFYWEWPNLRF